MLFGNGLGDDLCGNLETDGCMSNIQGTGLEKESVWENVVKTYTDSTIH